MLTSRPARATGTCLLLSVTFLFLVTGMGNFLLASNGEKEKLKQAIQRVEKEIKNLKQRMKQEETRQNNRIREIEKEKRQAAEEIVRLKERSANLDRRIEQTEKRSSKLSLKIDGLEQIPRRTEELVRATGDRLQNLRRILPPSKFRKSSGTHKQSAKKRSGKESPVREGKGSGDVQKLQSNFQSMNELLRDSTEVHIFRESVRCADGRRRPSDVLRVGRVLVAYRSDSGNRMGIAVRGKNGFRWQKDLDRSVKAGIRTAMDGLKKRAGDSKRKAPEFTWMSVDPSLQMTREFQLGEKSLQERLVAGGPVMFPIAAIAVLGVFLVVERFWVLTGERSGVEELSSEVRKKVMKNRPEEAEELCENSSGAVSTVLKTLLRVRNRDTETVQDHVEEAILHELPRLERFLPTLSVLAAVAPLLGLLGTVTGIIETFDVIAIFGSGNQKLMAGGISEALITTASGLVIAIPLLLCHGFFKGRVDAIVGDMEREAASLYNLLQNGKKTDSNGSSGESDALFPEDSEESSESSSEEGTNS